MVNTLFQRVCKKSAGLEVIKRLLEETGNPHLTFPTVHVAGTNGKGQTSVKIAKALEKGGYKVGLYTSPHIVNMEERISINGVLIPRETALNYFYDLEQLIGKHQLEPIFFDCITWMGFCYFARENVDIAVIEAGLGGILDQTNVIQPCLSIITSIGIDHVDYLGDTKEKIAEKKAGIIKLHTPVVLGPKALIPVFVARATHLKAPIHLVKEESPLYEQENTFVAKRALQVLSKQFPVSEEAIEEGIKQNLPCRFERRGKGIYDVAHNPAAFARLKEALEWTYPHQTFHFVIGINRNKDIKQCLMEIEPLARHIHFVSSDHCESATPEKLGDILKTFSACPFSVEETIEAGVKCAKTATEEENIFVVCGSFYIMAQALRKH